MSEDKSLWQQALAKRAQWAKEQPSLSAQLKAMGREAAKDINSTMHQVFFGSPAGFGEPGTPLNPTPQMVTQDLDAMGGYKAMLDGYSQKGPTAQLHDKGIER